MIKQIQENISTNTVTQRPNQGWLGLETAPFWGLRVHAHCSLPLLPLRRWGYTFKVLETTNPVKNDYTFAKRAGVPETIFGVVSLNSTVFLTAVWSVRARQSWGRKTTTILIHYLIDIYELLL